MARGKVQMKRIENPVHRQVTFCKRRAGLLKKARELSVLCDAEIGIFIFSAHGKRYELATKGTMLELIERYMKSTGLRGAQLDEHQAMDTSQHLEMAKREINLLKQEINILQKGPRLFGGEIGTMTLDELLLFEKNLELWIYHTRSAKMDIIFQEIQLLRNKEGMLISENKLLQDKIEENNGVVTNFAPLIQTTMPGPLTLQDEIFQL
ncbi:hypothetical protein SLE2022_383520 [Rubroshorea leprosula]